jgi:hypothetical protein
MFNQLNDKRQFKRIVSCSNSDLNSNLCLLKNVYYIL